MFYFKSRFLLFFSLPALLRVYAYKFEDRDIAASPTYARVFVQREPGDTSDSALVELYTRGAVPCAAAEWTFSDSAKFSFTVGSPLAFRDFENLKSYSLYQLRLDGKTKDFQTSPEEGTAPGPVRNLLAEPSASTITFKWEIPACDMLHSDFDQYIVREDGTLMNPIKDITIGEYSTGELQPLSLVTLSVAVKTKEGESKAQVAYGCTGVASLLAPKVESRSDSSLSLTWQPVKNFDVSKHHYLLTCNGQSGGSLNATTIAEENRAVVEGLSYAADYTCAVSVAYKGEAGRKDVTCGKKEEVEGFTAPSEPTLNIKQEVHNYSSLNFDVQGKFQQLHVKLQVTPQTNGGLHLPCNMENLDQLVRNISPLDGSKFEEGALFSSGNVQPNATYSVCFIARNSFRTESSYTFREVTEVRASSQSSKAKTASKPSSGVSTAVIVGVVIGVLVLVILIVIVVVYYRRRNNGGNRKPDKEADVEMTEPLRSENEKQSAPVAAPRKKPVDKQSNDAPDDAYQAPWASSKVMQDLLDQVKDKEADQGPAIYTKPHSHGNSPEHVIAPPPADPVYEQVMTDIH